MQQFVPSAKEELVGRFFPHFQMWAFWPEGLSAPEQHQARLSISLNLPLMPSASHHPNNSPSCVFLACRYLVNSSSCMMHLYSGPGGADVAVGGYGRETGGRPPVYFYQGISRSSTMRSSNCDCSVRGGGERLGCWLQRLSGQHFQWRVGTLYSTSYHHQYTPPNPLF